MRTVIRMQMPILLVLLDRMMLANRHTIMQQVQMQELLLTIRLEMHRNSWTRDSLQEVRLGLKPALLDSQHRYLVLVKVRRRIWGTPKLNRPTSILARARKGTLA